MTNDFLNYEKAIQQILTNKFILNQNKHYIAFPLVKYLWLRFLISFLGTECYQFIDLIISVLGPVFR